MKNIILLFLIVYTSLVTYENILLFRTIKALDMKIALTQEIQTLKKAEEDNSRPLNAPTSDVLTWDGVASYYSVAGCLGCRSDLLTASGEKFDENKLTLAFNWLPMGTWVKVINSDNGKHVVAKVNDTGGFNALGRIADLSLGTKNALECNDLCNVRIVAIQK